MNLIVSIYFQHFFVSILRIFGRLRILAAVCGLASDHPPLRIWASMQKWWPANNAVICTLDSAKLGRRTLDIHEPCPYFSALTSLPIILTGPLRSRYLVGHLQGSYLSRSDLIVAHLVYYLFWAETIWCRRLKTGCLPRHPECCLLVTFALGDRLHPALDTPFCLFVFLSFCLFVFLSFCLFVFLSFWLFVFLSFCLSSKLEGLAETASWATILQFCHHRASQMKSLR